MEASAGVNDFTRDPISFRVRLGTSFQTSDPLPRPLGICIQPGVISGNPRAVRVSGERLPVTSKFLAI